MAIGYILLLVFGGYVALKYFSVQISIGNKTRNSTIARPGVNYYCAAPQPNRAAQVLAYNEQNQCQTTEPGFAPSLGPTENQPNSVTFDI
jgi:hypothetical protein